MRNRRIRAASMALLWLVACSSDEAEAPTPNPTPVADDDDTPANDRGTAPWLVVEVTSQDSDALLRGINDRSGYLRIALYGADPAFEEPDAVLFQGPVNPTVKLLDVDGDGSLDVTADVDVPSIEGGDSTVATLLVSSSAVNAGRQVSVGVVAYDFLGNSFAQALGGERLAFDEPGTEPVFTRVGPIDIDGSPPPCVDGVDNDGDGWTDDEDPDCDGGAAIEVGFGTTSCNDGIENDGDSLTDAADPDCTDARDLSERPACADGVDNDGDGWIDDMDPDCESGGPEAGYGGTPCNNGTDDDEDGRVDTLDADCASATSSEE